MRNQVTIFFADIFLVTPKSAHTSERVKRRKFPDVIRTARKLTTNTLSLEEILKTMVHSSEGHN